eukprot:6220855-Alexandrium_andersonii.AAC.1
MVGGMRTAVTRWWKGAGRLCTPEDSWCPCCQEAVLPDLEHVMWACEAFRGLRDPDLEPSHPVARRLGWYTGWEGALEPPQVLRARLSQMGAIRAAELALAKKGARAAGFLRP